MTSQTFNLDLIPQGVPPIVHVSQYDKGQTWEIHLFENGVVFPIPANTSAAVQGTKQDNTGFQYAGTITAGSNVVEFTLEQQMTVFSGEMDCELVLANGDNQVATINFILDVEPTTLDDDTIISETELPLIEQAAELGAVINNYATQIHADAETASTAASTATSAASSASADAATATAAADDALASKTAAATSATNAAASASAAASSESNAATSATNAAASAAAAQAAIATDMTGATASAAGVHGLVPAPAAGDENKFLTGGGTWENVVIPPQSYVGMVIHSTTLDTEAKVKAQYGGTTWIQHSGYFLRGAASGVTANDATKTGGNDTHSHGLDDGYAQAIATGGYFYEKYRVVSGVASSIKFSIGVQETTGGQDVGYVIPLGGDTSAESNVPSFKSVYIWERTA